MIFSSFFSMDLLGISIWSVLFRLFFATAAGGILGIERALKRRPAGFRTYILVCLGSTLVMMTGQFVAQEMGGTDPARLGAQVISGIGFLGAGTIITTGSNKVRGLTTAAELWVASCLGLAIGAGFYFAALVTLIIIIAVMTLFNKIQNRIVATSRDISVYVIFSSTVALNEFIVFLDAKKINILEFEMLGNPTDSVISGSFYLRYPLRRRHKMMIKDLKTQTGVLYLKEM